MVNQTKIISGFLFLLRIFLGGLFIYAGIVKALNPSQFFIDIQSYHLLPHFLAVAMAIYLPWLEIVCGGALVFKKHDSGALILLLTMMTIFILALSSAWVRGLDISCGCFGKQILHVSYPWLLARDIGILTGIMILVRKAKDLKR